MEIKWYEMYDDAPDYHVEGVFCHLHDRYGNWQNFVELAGGGVKSRCLPYLLDLDPEHLFLSYWDSFGPKAHSPNNTWIQVHLKMHQLAPKYYTLATSYVPPNNSSPKSWKLFGSVNGQTWDELDDEKNVVALDASKHPSKRALRTFPIKNKYNGRAFTWFKLVQSQNWTRSGAPNEYELRLNGFELYGTLYDLQ